MKNEEGLIKRRLPSSPFKKFAISTATKGN